MSNEGKVVLITGASSGMGKSLAEYLSKRNYKVYGTSRKLKTFIEERKVDNSSASSYTMLKLDVCDDVQVENVVDYVNDQEGRIDILVNCAGFALAGAIEDTTAQEAFSEFDTNFFGVLRMCRNVIPIMRKNKSGVIVNVSSVAGIISVPFQSMYSASKFALEAMTEALRSEIWPFNIKVVLIEPGDTKTGFTDNRIYTETSKNNSAYGKRFSDSVDTMVKSELGSPGPESVVKTIARVIEMKNPPVRIVIGFSYKLFAFLKRILPSRLVVYIVGKLYS